MLWVAGYSLGNPFCSSELLSWLLSEFLYG
jgi:hypothetical protein